MSLKNLIFDNYDLKKYVLCATTYGFHCDIEAITGALSDKAFDRLDRKDYGVVANLGLTNLQRSTEFFYEHSNCL